RMLVELRDFIAREGWQDLLLMPFFSMVDRRKALHNELLASTRAQVPAILSTEIPYWSEIERMSVRRAPLPAFAPKSEAAGRFSALWSEVGARMEGPGLEKEPAPHAPAAVLDDSALADLTRQGRIIAALNHGNPVLVQRDPITREPRGVAPELAR